MQRNNTPPQTRPLSFVNAVHLPAAVQHSDFVTYRKREDENNDGDDDDVVHADDDKHDDDDADDDDDDDDQRVFSFF